jgi:hypothetical protein
VNLLTSDCVTDLSSQGANTSGGTGDPTRFVRWWALAIVPVAYLGLLHWISNGPIAWSNLVLAIAWTIAVLLGARYTRPEPVGRTRDLWPWPAVLAAFAGVVAAAVYARSGATWAAWLLLGVLYIGLLGLHSAIMKQGGLARRVASTLFAMALAGLIPVCILGIESSFADEEFFAALQVLALGVLWSLMWATRHFQSRYESASLARGGVRCQRRWLIAGVLVLAAAVTGLAVRAYRHSFYPPASPTFQGVTAATPFICDDESPALEPFDGAEVFKGLLAEVEANPQKGLPEYGMLAVGTGDQRWAQQFRESLLAEAAAGRFTEPAHSMKSAQYLAALRAYYLIRVGAQFPDLFSGEELALLHDWFAAINRRAMTVEWVDWLYALAFSKQPEGPYENQEIGAGLLALLESGNLAAPDLSSANRDYLDRSKRGWSLRFRNTDDALIYQAEWINNAYFQVLNSSGIVAENVRKAFEWLLLQALPDGGLPWYNHPARPAYVGTAYLGAELLKDPRYLWLAGQALIRAKAEGDSLWAQPGVEQSVLLTDRPSLPGSCLLYGDSGLPNQVGPLAPDKIVFRDGWSADSSYLLLNLRFTGWHRYKATNTVTLVYQAGPLAADVLEGKSFAWLPEGRSLFRDKRIPRENLNGLLVGRTGLSAVIHALTGIGGPWAQDPPYYAEVIDFATGDERDSTHTRVTGWRGWQHDRWVYFYHDEGPIVVLDEASGPAAGRGELIWHLIGPADSEDAARIRLRNGPDPAEFVLVPLLLAGQRPAIKAEGTGSSQLAVSYPAAGGQLRVATVFLVGPWVGADVMLDADGRSLRISQQDRSVVLPLPLTQ